MTLPALDNWESTRDSLHQAALLLNAVKIANADAERNHLHHSLYVVADGLTTGKLRDGLWLSLHFGAGRLALRKGDHMRELEAINTTQASLAAAVVAQGASFDQSRANGQAPLLTKPDLAAEYARALYRIYTATARFRATLYGLMTPIVLWPHHFDLSFLWFATLDDDENKPQLNFGFSPGSGAERPYFYVTAYPRPDGLTDLQLPIPARWNTDGWIGVRIEYDDIRNSPDPEAQIETLYRGIYDTLAPLMKGQP